MITEQLLYYVAEEKRIGKKKSEINENLLRVGWRQEDIDKAFDKLEGGGIRDLGDVSSSKGHKGKEGKLLKAALIIVLGLITILALSFFYLSTNSKKTQTENVKTEGFQAKAANDGKRISDALAIQDKLEKYYEKNQKYPASLDELENVPRTPTGSNYAYTPIGSPASRYRLNAQMDELKNEQITVENGFMTLKNKQGVK